MGSKREMRDEKEANRQEQDVEQARRREKSESERDGEKRMGRRNVRGGGGKRRGGQVGR